MLDNVFENSANKGNVLCEKEVVPAVVDGKTPPFPEVESNSPEKTTITKTVTVKDENLNEPTQEDHVPPVPMIRENYSKNAELAVQNKTEQSEMPTNVLQTGTDSEKNEDIQVESFRDEIRNGVTSEMAAKTDVSRPSSTHTRDKSDTVSNKRNVDTEIPGDGDESGKSCFEEKCLNQVIVPEGEEGKSRSESNIQEILSSEHISNIGEVVLKSDPIPATTNNKQEEGIDKEVDQLNHNFTTQKPEVTTKPQKSEMSETDKVTRVLYAVLNSVQKEKRMQEQISILSSEVSEDKDDPRKDKRIREEQAVVVLNVSQLSKVDKIDENGTYSTHEAGEEKNPDEIEKERGKRPRLSGNDDNCEVASETVEIRMDHHGPTVSDTQLIATMEDERNRDERNRKHQMTEKSNEIEDNGNKDARYQANMEKSIEQRITRLMRSSTHCSKVADEKDTDRYQVNMEQNVEQRITSSMRSSTHCSKVTDEKDTDRYQVNMEQNVEQRITRSMRSSTHCSKVTDENMVGLNNTDRYCSLEIDRKQQLPAEKRTEKKALIPLQAEEFNERRRTRSCTKQTFSERDNKGSKRQCKLMKRKKPVPFEEVRSSEVKDRPKSASVPPQMKVDFKNIVEIQGGTEKSSSSQTQSERNTRQKDGLFNMEDEPVTRSGKKLHPRVSLL